MKQSDDIRAGAVAESVKLIAKTHSLNEEEYLEFKARCEKDGFTASQILRAFIKTYRAEGEK